MKFKTDTVFLHGGRKSHILKPLNVNHDIIMVNDGKGFYYMIGNGSGYSFLSEVFYAAMTLNENEFIYLKFDFHHENAYNFWGIERRYVGIILFNYCTTQIKSKDILLSLRANVVESKTIEKSVQPVREYIDRWATNKRLTVKEHSSQIIISTNKDGFEDLTISCLRLAEYGNDIEYNDYPPHMHHDWTQNTSKSPGITLQYWQDDEKKR